MINKTAFNGELKLQKTRSCTSSFTLWFSRILQYSPSPAEQNQAHICDSDFNIFIEWGLIQGHRYTWRKNLQEGIFELFIDFTTEHAEASGSLDSNENDFSPDIPDTDDLLTYYCSALLVNAIPADSKVEFWVSVQ